jgi:hypothetical protein
MGKEVIQLMGKFKSECGNTVQWLIKKVKKQKAVIAPKRPPVNAQPSNIQVATIAVILDGEVQEVIRAQDRMAALFLSEPSFVEVPEYLEDRPTIGWLYKDGTFSKKENN